MFLEMPIVIGMEAATDTSPQELRSALAGDVAVEDLKPAARNTLLGVALGAKPGDTTVSVQPLVNICLALEPLDAPFLGAWVLGNDLPIVFGDPLYSENDSGFFAHPALCKPAADWSMAAFEKFWPGTFSPVATWFSGAAGEQRCIAGY
jgi:hypothetical protein